MVPWCQTLSDPDAGARHILSDHNTRLSTYNDKDAGASQYGDLDVEQCKCGVQDLKQSTLSNGL